MEENTTTPTEINREYNRDRINEYCDLEKPTGYDLFKLFSDLTGFNVEKFRQKLREKL